MAHRLEQSGKCYKYISGAKKLPWTNPDTQQLMKEIVK